MEAEAPLACTLPPDTLHARLAWIQGVNARGLVAHEFTEATLRLRYSRDVAAELERIVTAEQACCAFLRFELQRHGDEVLLTIQAPDGLDTNATWLFDQFLPKPRVAAGRTCGCAPGRCA